MIKSYLISLYFFVGFSTIAQLHKLDSVIHTVNGAQFITSQKYKQENKKAEIIRYECTSVDDPIRKTERIQVTYDNKGNELCHILSLWNSESKTWDEKEKTTKEFNANNQLIRVITHQKINNQWSKVFESTRMHIQDSIIETDSETREDKFQPIHKNISVINAFGKIKSYETFLWDDQKQIWEHLTRTTNQYQEDTILVGFEALKWGGNQWQKQEKITYILDTNSLVTDSYIQYNGHNNDWMPISKFKEEALPEQNKKISRTYKWSETDNKWIVSSQIETFFNKKQKKQDVLYSELNTSTLQLQVQLEQMNLYDQKGRLTLFQEFDYSQGSFSGTQNTIKFDKEGNVIRENLYEIDVENNTWKEKITTELTYYKNIEVNPTFEAHKKNDFFGLNEHNYIMNKYATKQVKVYKYEREKKFYMKNLNIFTPCRNKYLVILKRSIMIVSLLSSHAHHSYSINYTNRSSF